MTHFAIAYEVGLLAFWLGFVALVIALCKSADRGECCGACACEESDPCS